MRATGKAVAFIGTCMAVLFGSATLVPDQVTAAEQVGASERRAAPVKTGEVAPDFTLADQDGRKHTLSAERGRRPVVLIFYRGYW